MKRDSVRDTSGHVRTGQSVRVLLPGSRGNARLRRPARGAAKTRNQSTGKDLRAAGAVCEEALNRTGQVSGTRRDTCPWGGGRTDAPDTIRVSRVRRCRKWLEWKALQRGIKQGSGTSVPRPSLPAPAKRAEPLAGACSGPLGDAPKTPPARLTADPQSVGYVPGRAGKCLQMLTSSKSGRNRAKGWHSPGTRE